MDTLLADLQEVVRRPSTLEAEEDVRTLIRWAGDDPQREGLRDTPSRVAKAYRELFSGYSKVPETILAKTFSETSGYDDIVLVTGIAFYSHCEHHMLPFKGVFHIGYVPDGPVLGLSKMARLVEIYARRLQTQENLTAQIAGALNEHVKPAGVAVMCEAEHACMEMRGVKTCGTKTTTLSFLGTFQSAALLQSRFMQLVRGR